MQSTKKSNSRATSRWDGNILTIEVIGCGSVLFDRSKASEANDNQAALMGWNARFIDRMAKSVDKKTGRSVSAAEKLESVQELVDYYESGDVPWKMSGAGGSGDGLHVRCLMEMRPDKSRETIKAYLETLDGKTKTGLLNSPAILPIANRLRAESAAHIDADAALGDLDAFDMDAEIAAEMADEADQGE
jgi:hypothetical protein